MITYRCLASFHTVFQSIFSTKHTVIFKDANAKPALQRSTGAFVWLFSQNALARGEIVLSAVKSNAVIFVEKNGFLWGLGEKLRISIFIKVIQHMVFVFKD